MDAGSSQSSAIQNYVLLAEHLHEENVRVVCSQRWSEWV